MQDEWITIKEASMITGISERTLKWQCRQGRYTTRMVDGNGGAQYRILRQSLSDRVQGAEGSRVPVENPLVSPLVKGEKGEPPIIYNNAESMPEKKLSAKSGEDGGALQPSEPTQEACLVTPFPGTTSSVLTNRVQGAEGSRVQGEIKKAGLATWQADIARARFDLVMEYIAVTRDQGLVTSKKIEFTKFYNTGIPLPELFKKIGTVAKATLDTWERAIRDSNYNSDVLAVRYGEHRRGLRKVADGEMTALLRFALHPNRLPISEIIRHAKKLLEQQSGEWRVASDATLRRALYDWRDRNYDRWVFLREGEKAWNDKCCPYLVRDSEMLQVGDVLVADGHTLNFTVLNPFTGRPGRATLIMFYDWASRMPAGWNIMMTENVQCIHAALRRAILTLGKIPTYVLLDNGKAFKGRFFKQTPDFEQAGIAGLYARLGVCAKFALPYHAQTKPVERFFGTFAELERLMPTYSGTSIENKPAHMRQNEKLHKRLHDRVTGGFMPTIQQADTIIRQWIESEYAQRPHSGLNGKLPGEVFTAGRGPGIDERVLIELMMSTEIKTVHRNGVRFLGVDWFGDELYGYRGRVMVRYDDLDMRCIYVYEPDGSRLLCQAMPVGTVHPMVAMSDDPMDRRTLEEGLKMKAQFRKSTVAEVRELAENLTPFEIAQGSRVQGVEGSSEKKLLALRPADEERQIPEECVQERDSGNNEDLISPTPNPEPPTPDSRPYFLEEYERYEWHLENGCAGPDDEAFMAYFKKTEVYENLYQRESEKWNVECEK